MDAVTASSHPYKRSASLNHFNYAPSDCDVPSCDVCPALTTLDAEILLAQNHLASLQEKRQNLMSSINNCHDKLTCGLPPELLSKIFEFYCTESDEDEDEDEDEESNKPPLIIGEVCKYWRDVTLRTPQLWSTVTVTMNADTPCPYDIDVAAEWLSRSRSLPLSLYIALEDYEFDSKRKSILSVIDLLRSHSVRWKNMTINYEFHPVFLPLLFDDLDNIPMDFGVFKVRVALGVDDEDVAPQPVLYPKELWASNLSSTLGFPLGWDRLTRVSSFHSLYLDELVRIIQHAPKLEYCSITGGDLVDTDIFPLPDRPIVSRSLTYLELSTTTSWELSESLLSYLTLPSLTNFSYVYYCYSPDDPDLAILDTFLARSAPHLQTFSLSITPQILFPLTHSRINELHHSNNISPTSLEFDTSEIASATSDTTVLVREFFALLASVLACGALPKLRQLVLNVPITRDFWLTLADFLERIDQVPSSDPDIRAATTLTEIVPTSRRCSILKSVDIEYPDPFVVDPSLVIDSSVICRLVEIGKSGIDMTLRHQCSEFPLSRALAKLLPS